MISRSLPVADNLTDEDERHVAFCERNVALYERPVALYVRQFALFVRHVALLLFGQRNASLNYCDIGKHLSH